jgi:hypothetical protein
MKNPKIYLKTLLDPGITFKNVIISFSIVADKTYWKKASLLSFRVSDY